MGAEAHHIFRIQTGHGDDAVALVSHFEAVTQILRNSLHFFHDGGGVAAGRINGHQLLQGLKNEFHIQIHENLRF